MENIMTTFHIIRDPQGSKNNFSIKECSFAVPGLYEVEVDSVGFVEINITDGVVDKIELSDAFFMQSSPDNYVADVLALKKQLQTPSFELNQTPSLKLNMDNTQVVAPYQINSQTPIHLAQKKGQFDHKIYSQTYLEYGKEGSRFMQSFSLSAIRTPEEKKQFIKAQKAKIFNKAHANLTKDDNSVINQLYKFKDTLLSIIKGSEHKETEMQDMSNPSKVDPGSLPLTQARKHLRQELMGVLKNDELDEAQKLKQVKDIQAKNNALSYGHGKKDDSGRLGHEISRIIESMKDYEVKEDNTTTPGLGH